MNKYIPKIRIANLINNQLFCLCDYNCILSINLDDFSVKYAGGLVDEYFFQRALSCHSSVYKNGILYSSYYSKNIHFFDIERNKDDIITYSCDINLAKDMYCGLIHEGSKYYAIPYIGKKILEIDIDEKKVTKTINICNILKRKGVNFYKNFFSFGDGCRCEDKYFIPMDRIPYIVVLDFMNDNYEAIRLGEDDNGLGGMACMDNTLYIYSKDHFIITYNTDQKKIIKKVKIPGTEDDYLYTAIVYDNNIYFLNNMYFLKNNKIIAVRYNVKTHDVECIRFNDKLINISEGEEYKFVGLIDKNEAILISNMMNMAIMDLKTNVYRQIQLKYNIEELKENITQNIYFYSENIESSGLALPCFIRHKRHCKGDKIGNCVGEKIYWAIQ